jgi:Matrixin
MASARSPLRRLRRARPRLAVPILVAATLAVVALGRGGDLPVLAAAGPQPWPGGKLTYYDTSGSRKMVDAAAARWNVSGADVRIVPARDRRSADVVFLADGKALAERCGYRCLGLSSSIGRPADGRVTVLLNPSITGTPTPIGVWVAMHELGHVLGLSHREGTCSLMNAHAYDDSCSFASDSGPLPCGPASRDVDAVARLYGRDEAARPCR